VSSPRLATTLDQEMIEAYGVVASARTPDHALPRRPGSAVAAELGNRLLLRYLVPTQLGSFTSGSVGRQHWVTPTPYTPQDAATWLALPNALNLRTFVMLLDPSLIPHIDGPRWVRFGHGIEYLLANGFPAPALIYPPELPVS